HEDGARRATTRPARHAHGLRPRPLPAATPAETSSGLATTARAAARVLPAARPATLARAPAPTTTLGAVLAVAPTTLVAQPCSCAPTPADGVLETAFWIPPA